MKADQKRDKYNDPFPARLRELMEDGHVRQQMLADAIGVKRQTISAYSDGSADPTLPKLAAMADYFKCSVDYLLSRAEGKTPDKEQIHQRLGLTDGAIEKLDESYHSESLFPSERGYPTLISALIETKEGRELLHSINQYVLADLSKIYASDLLRDDKPEDNGSDMVTFRARPGTLFQRLGFTMKAERLESVFLLDITNILKDFRKAVQSGEYWAPYHPQDQPLPDPEAEMKQAHEKLAARLASENEPSTIRKKGKHVNPEDPE